jgi:hypothetical protein
MSEGVGAAAMILLVETFFGLIWKANESTAM